MKRSLEMAGFSVAEESDPIEAFKYFRPDAYHLVSLVILDIRMPNIDGIELYGKLRKIDRKFNVCFISMFVAGEYENLRQQYPELVENRRFIEKPVTMTKLVQIVKSQLSMPEK